MFNTWLFYMGDEWDDELQRTPTTHPVTTPRFNLAFVKLGNFDEITTYYDKCEKAVKSP